MHMPAGDRAAHHRDGPPQGNTSSARWVEDTAGAGTVLHICLFTNGLLGLFLLALVVIPEVRALYAANRAAAESHARRFLVLLVGLMEVGFGSSFTSDRYLGSGLPGTPGVCSQDLLITPGNHPQLRDFATVGKSDQGRQRIPAVLKDAPRDQRTGRGIGDALPNPWFLGGPPQSFRSNTSAV
jgi:hypothetical protein